MMEAIHYRPYGSLAHADRNGGQIKISIDIVKSWSDPDSRPLALVSFYSDPDLRPREFLL